MIPVSAVPPEFAGMRTVRLDTEEPSPWPAPARASTVTGDVPGAAVSTVAGPWPTTSIAPPLPPAGR